MHCALPPWPALPVPHSRLTLITPSVPHFLLLCSCLLQSSCLPCSTSHSHCLSAFSPIPGCRDAAGFVVLPHLLPLPEGWKSLFCCSHVLILPDKSAEELLHCNIKLSVHWHLCCCPAELNGVIMNILRDLATDTGMCLRKSPARWQIKTNLYRSNNASPSPTTDIGTQQMAHRSQISQRVPKCQTLPSVTLTPDRGHQLQSASGMTEHKETWGKMTTEPEWFGGRYILGTTWTHKPALIVLGVCPISPPKPMAWYSGARGGRSSISQPHHTIGGSKALAAVKTTGKELFLCGFEGEIHFNYSH